MNSLFTHISDAGCAVCGRIAITAIFQGDVVCSRCYYWASEALGWMIHADGNDPPCCMGRA